MELEYRSTRRKTSRNKGESQQQSHPAYDDDVRIWTLATGRRRLLLLLRHPLLPRYRMTKIKGWLYFGKNTFPSRDTLTARPQKSPYFCVLKYARALKQKVWSEAENEEWDWGAHSPAGRIKTPWGSRALRTLYWFLYRFWGEKIDCFAVYDTVLRGSLKKII